MLNTDLANVFSLSPWWLAVPLATLWIFGVVSYYHWIEMISEINARVPEEEQIPYSGLDIIGKPNKFELCERSMFWNIWRIHKQLFPDSRRRRLVQLATIATALGVLALFFFFSLIGNFS